MQGIWQRFGSLSFRARYDGAGFLLALGARRDYISNADAIALADAIRLHLGVDS